MNWYSVFYWVMVADGVKKFFDTSSDVFTTFAIISFIVFFVTFIAIPVAIGTEETKNDEEDQVNPLIRGWKLVRKYSLRIMYTSLILAMITWMGYIFIPSKKDSLTIIAGGAVGNFITHDSSAKQIPSEVMLLLRAKIKDEINDINTKNIISNKDTLVGKTKEELIEIIKDKVK